MGRTKIATHIAELHRHLHEAEKNRQLILSKIGALKDSCLKAEISYSEYEKRLSTPVSGKSLTEWVHYYDSYIKLCNQHIESLHRQHKKQTYTKYFLLVFSAIFLIFFLKSSFTGFVISDQDSNYNTYTQDINQFFTENTQIPFMQENAGEILGVSFSGKIYGEGNAKIYFNDILISDINSKSADEVSAFRGLTGFVIGEEESSDSTSSDSQNSGSQDATSSNSQQQDSEDSPSHTSTTSEPAETNNPQINSEEESENEPIAETTETQPSQSQQQPEEATPIESPSHTPTQAAQTNISDTSNSIPQENETVEESVQPTENKTEQSEKEYSFTFVCNVDCDLLQYSIEQLEHSIKVELDGVNLSLESIKYTVPKESSDNATIINETISLESPIVIEEPVQWKKEITLDKPGEITVELPSEAKSISAVSTDDSDSSETVEINNKIKKTSESGDNIQQVTLSGNSDSYEVLYETQAPKVTEDLVSQTQKEITISAPDELNYTNVVSFTDLPHPMQLEEVSKIKLYWEVNGTNVEHPFTVNDTDNDGLVDRLQWITPHLSEQHFTIIIITKAEHLDSNKEFIADIYDSVKELDGTWSQIINDSEYVRVTFEQKLTNKNDITLYPRIVSGTPAIEIYEIDGDILIANFTSLNENVYNKLFLTNLQSPEQTVFDLKVIGGAVEFDHIIDPTPAVLPTGRRNGMFVSSNSTSQLPSYFTWNGTNWSARADALSIGGIPEWLTVRAGIVRDEYILLSADNQDDINIQMNFTNSSGQRCWGNGTACNVVWEVNSTSTTANVQKADLAYSHKSGDALAVWSDNSRRPIFTVWNGSFWSRPRAINDSAVSNIGTIALTGANIETVQLAPRSNNSDEIALLLTDSNDDSEVIIWNGTGFYCESPILSTSLGTGNVQKADLDYEDLSGDLFIASILSTTSYNITTKAADTCTFVSSKLTVNDAEFMDVAAQSGTDNIMLVGSLGGTTDDMEARVWRGSAWGNTSAEDTSVYAAAAGPNQFFSAAWAGLKAGVLVYSDAANTAVDWFHFNTTSMAWQGAPATDFTPTPAFSTTGESNIKAYSFMDENKTMTFFKDANLTHSKIWAKIFNAETNTWQNAETGQQPLIWNSSSSSTFFPSFDFTWQKYISPLARDIKYPLNTTYTANVSMLNYTRASTSSYCWYSTNNGATNSSPSATCANFTNVLSVQGSNTWTLYNNDSLGVWDSDNVTFFLDSITPIPTISYPSNTTYNVNMSALNYTYVEANPGYCWYSTNNGVTNSSLVDCGTNFSNVVSVQGSNNWRLYMNDSFGKLNMTNITFFMDTILPTIQFGIRTTGNDTTIRVNNIFVNVTANDTNLRNISIFLYNSSLNIVNNSNLTISPFFLNITNLPDGNYTFNATAYDIVSNVNYTGTYQVRIDSTIPVMYISYPSNTSYDINVSMLNYTFTEINPGYCWYSTNNGVTNSSLVDCGTNFTNVLSVQGSNNWRLYMNDSFGNLNMTNITFSENIAALPSLLVSYTFPSSNSGDPTTVFSGVTASTISNDQALTTWELPASYAYPTDPELRFGPNNGGINAATAVSTGSYISFTVTPDSDKIMNLTSITFEAARGGAGAPRGWVLRSSVDSYGSDIDTSDINTVRTVWSYFTVNLPSEFGSLKSSVTFRLYAYAPSTGSTLEIDDLNVSGFLTNKTFPLFSNYKDNNGTLVANGVAWFNVTVLNTNGTVLLQINNTNYTATNVTANVFNVSITNLLSGTQAYQWMSWGNESDNTFNISESKTYTINASRLAPNVTITYPLNTTYNVNVSTLNYTCTGGAFALYSRDNFVTNSSVVSCGTNFTNVLAVPGTNTWRVAVNDSSNNLNITNVTFWFNSVPQIIRVFAVADQSITENSKTMVLINFTVQDSEGYSDINIATAKINLTRTGETTVRQNNTCLRYQQGGTVANFSCNLDIWYYDSAGEWNISIYIGDNGNLNATNMSTNLTILQTSSFVVGPSRVAFANLPPSSTNQTATNDPLVINNTGNKPITAGNIQVNATNLVGETDPSRALYAGNFSVGTTTGSNNECGATGATAMVNNAFTALSGATLPKGNNSVNDGITAQEQLYVCIKQIGSELTAQSYSTSNQGSWTIKILIVSLSLRRKKKVKEDRLFKIMMLLTEEVKEKHSPKNQEMIKIVLQQLAEKYDISTVELKEMMINSLEIEVPVSIFSSQLGALEALSLYLKDNKNLRFKDIASVLQRNEKTVWTAHHIAKEKKVQLTEAAGLSVPVKVLGKSQLTIFESLVTYLKDRKNMKYSEIGELLSRDQRNIWTIYNRALKKTDDKKTIVTLE